MEGVEKELEAEIQIMLHQKSNLKPTAYVLQVDVKERSRIPQSSNGGEPSVNSRNAANEIGADFPEFVNTESSNKKLAVTLEYLAKHRLDTSLRPASRDIVADVEDAFKTYFGGNVAGSLSMTKGALNALQVLRKRETEREGERLIREWQRQCELWGKLGGADEARLG